MGFLTPVLFYNDSIHEIEKDPTFTRRLFEACISSRTFEKEVPYRSFHRNWIDKILNKIGLQRIHFNDKNYQGSGDCASVLMSKHADEPRVLVIWGNTWMDFSDTIWRMNFKDRKKTIDMEYLKDCAKIIKQDLQRYNKLMKENKEKEEK